MDLFKKIRYFDQLSIQAFSHRCYSFISSVLKISYDLKVSFDLFPYIVLTQLRLEEVIVGKGFLVLVDPCPKL